MGLLVCSILFNGSVSTDEPIQLCIKCKSDHEFGREVCGTKWLVGTHFKILSLYLPG